MNLLEKFQSVSTFVFDVDGVLTDGSVLLLDDGLQARQMNIKDGLALQMALQNGYRVVILSGAASEPVIRRFQYLGVEEIHLGVKDKEKFMEGYCAQFGLDWNEILFMGDDLPDIGVLQRAGVSCCPADAAVDVKPICQYISTFNGGKGCVRDVIEKVLKSHGRWIYQPAITAR
jgi:3-deoxy-D-manno-octulosonate 8-phosphate phosphatase (KDO 8-P phosphatase)